MADFQRTSTLRLVQIATGRRVTIDAPNMTALVVTPEEVHRRTELARMLSEGYSVIGEHDVSRPVSLIVGPSGAPIISSSPTKSTAPVLDRSKIFDTSEDGYRVLTVEADDHCSVWNNESGELLEELTGERARRIIEMVRRSKAAEEEAAKNAPQGALEEQPIAEDTLDGNGASEGNSDTTGEGEDPALQATPDIEVVDAPVDPKVAASVMPPQQSSIVVPAIRPATQERPGKKGK